MNRRALLLSFVTAPLGIAACGSSSASTTASTAAATAPVIVTSSAAPTTAAATTAPSTTAAPTTTVATVTGEVVVLAAASLTGSFTAEAKAFEQANPGTKVTLSFGASSTLATQVVQGAPADVFASADQANIAKVTDPGLAAGPATVFATNRLAVIVARGNPKGITGLADLARGDLIVVLAAPEVPVGKYGRQALDKAKVAVTPKSLEADVKAVVSKVTLGEADAGIVYITDVKAAGNKAAGVAIPDDVNVLATYPAVVTKAAKNRTAAAAFLAFLGGTDGRKILADAGFGPP